jgi:hypothetical protein
MISINVNLRNPWSDKFKNLWSRAYATPFKNKHIELEVTEDFSLVTVMFNWTIRQSHAGVDLELGVFGYCIRVNFYDNRHWNYAKGCYYIFGETE